MKRILDFLYYFIYQLNRRGYKKNNYKNARFGVSVYIFNPLCILSNAYFDIINIPIKDKLVDILYYSYCGYL